MPSSFYLTPANYFDYDVAMESMNAIVITESKTPGRLYDYNENGVQQSNCVPPIIPPFSYNDMELVDLNGQSLAPTTLERLSNSDNVIRLIKVEL